MTKRLSAAVFWLVTWALVPRGPRRAISAAISCSSSSRTSSSAPRSKRTRRVPPEPRISPPGLGHLGELAHPTFERQEELALHHLGLARRPAERHRELVALQIGKELHRDLAAGDQAQQHHREEEHGGGRWAAEGRVKGFIGGRR